jgi:Ca2+-binding EF-hand superfamily protein
MASEQLVPQYLRVFDCFDKDHNGKLSPDELSEMLRVVKIPKKPKVEVRNDNSSPRTDSG